MRRAKNPRSLSTIQLFSFLVIVLLGTLMFIRKVEGQTPPVGSAVPTIGPRASASASAKPVTAPPIGSASAADAGGPLDYAVLPEDSDFPAGMSDEEKSAMGTGKVPIHREGEYRSPLAHPRFGGPAHVKVGLVINEIRSFDIKEATFEAEYFVSLTSDKDMPPIALTFTNGHEIVETVLVDTPTFKSYRYSGKFSTSVDLRTYPFDKQVLNIEMEDRLAGVDQVIFEADKRRTSLNSEFRLASFGVATVGAKSYKLLYPPRFDRDDLYVSHYKFMLGIDRFATSAAFSVFVPAFIIVIISLLGLWVPGENIDVRSNAGAPMLAAAVFFHYSLTQVLPATGYLTRADKLMLGVYVSLLLNMLSTWWFFLVPKDRWDHLLHIGRTWIPPVTMIIMIIASLV